MIVGRNRRLFSPEEMERAKHACSLLPQLMGGYGSSSGFQISRALRLRAVNSASLSRTPGVSSGTLKWTLSAWIKRSATAGVVQPVLFAGTFSTNDTGVYFDGNDNFNMYTRNGGAITGAIITTGFFRDPSAYGHLVAVYDSANATAGNRMQLWWNGVLLGVTVTTTLPQNTAGFVGSTTVHSIGALGATQMDGRLAEVNFIDGQALDPTAFGLADPVTGVWGPKAYGGSFGTNGFHLDFHDNSAATAAAIGADTSGNGNNWTPTGVSVAAGAANDSTTDTPTNFGTDTGVGGEVRGNYATLNPLNKNTPCTLSIGNLGLASSTVSAWAGVVATFGLSAGKWYWEYTIIGNADGNHSVGIANANWQIQGGTNNLPGITADGYSYVGTGNRFTNSVSTPYGATFGLNDTIGVALDVGGGTITFYKNGISQGALSHGLTAPLFPAAGEFSNTGNVGVINFGQFPFVNSAPAGYKAICTQNLTSTTVTTSGTFTGNAAADGPFVYLNGVPTTMTINGNAVTFGTHADKLANGFKLKTASASYNAAGSNSYSVTVNGAAFKFGRAQGNP